jgi:hypothetical protein
MDTTKKPAETGASAGPRAGERDRAKAYLDLWERHLVQTALNGPAPAWMPASA